MRLENYGLIGDRHTVALVGLDGSIDWLCLPRFDSGACFAAILGTEKNGCWKLNPTGPITKSTQAYRQDTLVLETVFETAEGAVRLIDCMPAEISDRRVVRIVEGLRGRVPMETRLLIRPDYGRTIPWVQHASGGITAVAGPNALVLNSDVETRGENLSTLAQFEVSAGERRFFVLTWYPSHKETPEPIDAERAVVQTELFWREWASRCTYQGEAREAVVRSVLPLKALAYAPTGGMVAAATTSLPEFIGGIRNWDYRYCWLRDATFTLYSFMVTGYTEEAAAWIKWLLRAVAGDAAQLQIMYGTAGERTLTEIELNHLDGYEGSRPVRVGNAASEQLQLDVYGEVMDALHLARTMGIPLDAGTWPLQRHLVEFVIKNWMQPDEGIWEIRGPRQHFTHSKIMSWVAIDRAVKAVEQFKLEGDLEEWKTLRETIHRTICEQGYNTKRGAFTQFYGSDKLDASLLMIPLVGFLPADDSRVIATVEAIQRELTAGGFVFRYRTDAGAEIDGLPPGEGVFLPCSFWLADCLHLMGRKEEARSLFDRLLSTRGALGLLAEEYDPTAKRFLGNFPQAFSHVGLVNTAHNLLDSSGPAQLRGKC